MAARKQHDMFIDEALERVSESEILLAIVGAQDIPEGWEINWYKILLQLEHEGLNMAEISRRTRINESRIKGWKSYNYRLRMEDGIRLLKYWRAITRKTIEQLPLKRIEVSVARAK